MTKSRLSLVVIGLLIAVGALAGWWLMAHRAPPPRYVTALASRGLVSRQITASGSVNPVVTVLVGAFVSGNIQTLACDFNTKVTKGQVCATIDPRPYQLTVDQDRAALETAQAQEVKDRAALQYAQTSYRRYATLLTQQSTSQDVVDTALSARDQALATVDLDAATSRQRQAALDAAQVSLGYTRILSPVDGTVISRNVNIGQTVAASFQTPTLFLIAQDLTKMEVDTNVSESDIAGATPGAPSTFTVEAFPGRAFQGRVSQVRQAPVSVQNVITYDVVVTTDNPDLLLKPGMTATTKITIASRENVLRVPDQALHFTPVSARAKGAAAPPPQVWVLRDKTPQPVPVTTGLDDGVFVEISGGELKVGDPVIVSASRMTHTASALGAPPRLGR